METNGKLSVVGTPIGNLEDMTLRAIRALKEVDYILCEDTRVTGKLLKHYEIETKMKRYDAHASHKVHEEILADLEAGKHIALVSDAGTPCVSDPGVILVQMARDAGARVETIPGASAVTAAFSISGVTGNQFAFLGFVPQKKGRQTFFKSLSSYKAPIIFYEAPHRIMKTLEALNEHLGSSFKVSVARELTKMHEEVVAGTTQEVLNYFGNNPEHVRGEFVVIVVPQKMA
jgi:16S rRNA (cytidine1402-2'-O)-methyltransferase